MNGGVVKARLSSNYVDNNFIIICFVMNCVYVLVSTKSVRPSNLHVCIIAKTDRRKQMVAPMLAA